MVAMSVTKTGANPGGGGGGLFSSDTHHFIFHSQRIIITAEPVKNFTDLVQE